MQLFKVLFATFIAFSLSACSESKQPNENVQVHAINGSFASAISDDAKFAVTSSIEHGVAFWDLQKAGLVYQWRHQENQDNEVFLLDIAPDNSVVMSAGKTTFALWSIADGKNIGFWKIRASTIRDIAVSNEGRYVLYGRGDGVVVHIDMQTGRRIEFMGHSEKINAVDLSPNGYYALTGGNDYTAYLWDTRSAQVIHRFNHGSRVTQVTLDKQGRKAFTADSQKQAQIWDLASGNLISNLQFTSRQQIFSAAQFSPDANLLATGSPSRKIALWDVASGKLQQKWLVAAKKDSRPASAVVYDLAFKDSQLLSSSSNGLLETWQLSGKQ